MCLDFLSASLATNVTATSEIFKKLTGEFIINYLTTNMHKKINATRKYLCQISCLLLLSTQVIYISSAEAATSTETKRLRIAFIGHSPTTEKWWDPVKNALIQAGEDYQIDVDFLNPKDGSIDEMARIISSISPERYSGVISTIADYEKLREPLLSISKEKHLPLITVNSGTYTQSESVGALFHVGQPETLAGTQAGEQARKAGVKSFVCIIRYMENAATHQRCNGFAQGLGLPVPGQELAVKGSDQEIEATVLQFVESHPNLGALLTMGPTEAHPTISALRKLKAGAHKPYFVTFDLSKQITAGISSGIVDFAIDQQPYLQGYIPAAVLAYKIRHPEASILVSEMSVFADVKLNRRASKYGLTLKPSNAKNINSGPGFVNRLNVDKIDLYGGQYR